MTDALNDAAVLLQQATVWQQSGDVKRAEDAYRRILADDPANPDALNLLATIHHERGDRDLAVRMLRAAIAIRPDQGRYWNNLGVILGATGDRTGSVTALRQMTQATPDDVNGWMALIFAMDLHPYSLPSIRLADRRAFNARCCAALTKKSTPHENDRDPERKLRVGYVSADFKLHSAAMVFERVLSGHDHDVVDVTCYAALDGPGDEVTERCKGYANAWHNVSPLSDLELSEQIRADRIDILVDLSGYSGGNRLMAFARKPAPVQITAFGHVTGVGIDAMDYILADAVTIPSEQQGNYHERILRLPCLLSYDPGPVYPDVCPPPWVQNGYVTYGYLGRASKTSEEVWATWAEILHRVPHSRLILKANDYTDRSYRDKIADYLVSLRISGTRFEFRGHTDHQSHLGNYADVDVSLDSFPQGGGVTTFESCLMGVPTISLMGNYLNGRITPSILSALDHSEWIAETRQQYIALAVDAAYASRTHGDRLALRDRLLGSFMCSTEAYARSVEYLYRTAWRTWCESSQPSTNGTARFMEGAARVTARPDRR